MPEGTLAIYSKSLFFGGIERNILQQIGILKASGTNIVLVTHKNSVLLKPSPIKDKEVIAFEKQGIVTFFQLTKELKKKRIKSIIIYKPRELKAGFFIRLFSLFKIKIVFYQQERINIERNRFFLSFLSRWTDYWITPMNYLKEEIIRQGVPLKKEIRVIPHCINLEPYFNANLSMEEARKQLNLPVGRKIIGTLGRQNLEKRQDFLIRAINFLKLNGITFDLVIMGNPIKSEELEYDEFLKELVDECNLNDQVYFRRYLEDKWVFYRAIDVFVKNNSGEACDLKAIEAMATRTPIIAIHSNYNAELLNNGNLGMLYKVNDMEDFSDKLIKMLTKQKITDYFKEEGYKEAKARYHVNNNNHLFLNFVRELLE